MKKKMNSPSDHNEIILPEDQIEVIEVSPENIHIDSPSASSGRSSSPRSKNFSFNLHSHLGPLKLGLGKFFLGCALFLLLLLGILITFIVGITKILQKVFSALFN